MPRFRFNLSTLMVVMLEVAGVIYLNCRPEQCLVLRPHADWAPLRRCYGWPLVIYAGPVWGSQQKMEVPPTLDEFKPARFVRIHSLWYALFVNACCGLGIVVFVTSLGWFVSMKYKKHRRRQI